VSRLAPRDWLVSEVRRGNKRRGADLQAALAALRVCVRAAGEKAWRAAARQPSRDDRNLTVNVAPCPGSESNASVSR
jgi:hypothetical protein